MEGEGTGNETFSNLTSLKFPLSEEQGHCTIRGRVRLNTVCLATQRDDLHKAKLGLEADARGAWDVFEASRRTVFLPFMSNRKGEDKTVC